MSEKKRVLFSLVGTRDPYSCTPDNKGKTITLWNWKMTIGRDQVTRTEGSVLTACRWLEPDIVYLFPSSKEKVAQTDKPHNHTENNADEAKNILTSQFGIKECHVMPLMTDDATDKMKLYSCLRSNMRKVIDDITKDYPDKQEYIARNYELIFIRGSGTTQMKETVTLFLQSLPYEFKEYECKDPRYAQGKDRVVPLQSKLAEETLLLKSLDANLNSYYFHSVVENCDRLSQISILQPRRGVADILKDIFTAYECVDLMQYETAYDKIAPASEYYANAETKKRFMEKHPSVPLEKISGILSRQAKFLENLRTRVRQKDEGEDVNNLIDLYYNMNRAYVRGNYVDVLARFWRLREGMMNYRLLKYHYLDRRNLKKPFSDAKDEKKRKANYDTIAKSQYSDKVDWNNGWLRNDIGAISSLLRGLFNDLELKSFENRHQSQLEHLRDSRNQTIVAHGMLPVSKNTADMCITLAKEIVALIPGGALVCANYPFKLEDMREVLNFLKLI